jgi:hypothetical protein
MQPPRLVPDLAFPPYTFVPGLTPHPNHPGGHSHGKPSHPVVPLDPERWRECEAYLYGVDLFNGPAPSIPAPSLAAGRTGYQGQLPGYYWEAHEVWEGLWHLARRTGVVADMLKGLIQMTAAGVKVRQGMPSGVASLGRGAAGLFRGVRDRLAPGTSSFLGLNLAKLEAFTRELESYPVRWLADPDAAARVFAFKLSPG